MSEKSLKRWKNEHSVLFRLALMWLRVPKCLDAAADKRSCKLRADEAGSARANLAFHQALYAISGTSRSLARALALSVFLGLSQRAVGVGGRDGKEADVQKPVGGRRWRLRVTSVRISQSISLSNPPAPPPSPQSSRHRIALIRLPADCRQRLVAGGGEWAQQPFITRPARGQGRELLFFF